jgi:hypothetical protein
MTISPGSYFPIFLRMRKVELIILGIVSPPLPDTLIRKIKSQGLGL